MRKFTLLELLVAISIIGILASLLLPSLSKTKEKAINAICLSNLKQSALKAFIYQDENNRNMYRHQRQK